MYFKVFQWQGIVWIGQTYPQSLKIIQTGLLPRHIKKNTLSQLTFYSPFCLVQLITESFWAWHPMSKTLWWEEKTWSLLFALHGIFFWSLLWCVWILQYSIYLSFYLCVCIYWSFLLVCVYRNWPKKRPNNILY